MTLNLQSLLVYYVTLTKNNSVYSTKRQNMLLLSIQRYDCVHWQITESSVNLLITHYSWAQPLFSFHQHLHNNWNAPCNQYALFIQCIDVYNKITQTLFLQIFGHAAFIKQKSSMTQYNLHDIHLSLTKASALMTNNKQWRHRFTHVTYFGVTPRKGRERRWVLDYCRLHVVMPYN